eukprot:990947-Rhodomonas_salina.3
MSDQQQRVAAAKNEIGAFSDMYNRMLKQCFEKCVEHFHESELSLGENTCLDRNSPNPMCRKVRGKSTKGGRADGQGHRADVANMRNPTTYMRGSTSFAACSVQQRSFLANNSVPNNKFV